MAGPEGSSATPTGAAGPPSGPSATVLVISGRVTPADIPALSEQIRVLIEGDNTHLVVCDVKALVHPDAAAVDLLARAQLDARRSGREIQLFQAGDELQELLALMGLGNVVPLYAQSSLQVEGQIEQREEARGVSERRRGLCRLG